MLIDVILHVVDLHFCKFNIVFIRILHLSDFIVYMIFSHILHVFHSLFDSCVQFDFDEMSSGTSNIFMNP